MIESPEDSFRHFSFVASIFYGWAAFLKKNLLKANNVFNFTTKHYLPFAAGYQIIIFRERERDRERKENFKIMHKQATLGLLPMDLHPVNKAMCRGRCRSRTVMKMPKPLRGFQPWYCR